MITFNLYSMSVKIFTRLSVLLVMLLSCATTFAQEEQVTYPVIVGLGNGEFVITVNNGDQIKNMDLSTETYSALATATKLKIVCEGTNGKLTGGDLDKLAGKNGPGNENKPKISALASLDLEDAIINNNDEINKLNSAPELTKITFPAQDGLKIPKQAFKGNTKLETVIFPDRKSETGTYQILMAAFHNCTNLKTVSLGKGYTTNGEYTSDSGSGASIFEHCINLSNVVLDDGITELGAKAFNATYKLEYLILPAELVHVGSLCFKECGIRTVTLPEKIDLSHTGSQIFQGAVQLRNVYVSTDNMKAANMSIMEMNQTPNFKWDTDVTTPTYSVSDYKSTSTWSGSDYPSDSPFVGSHYTTPILHYPGTDLAIQNYRMPMYMHYDLTDPKTGTTWPSASDINNIQYGKNVDGTFYEGFNYQHGQQSEYAGFRQFVIGGNIFKEQKVFYDERIKESRWYSICLPINMTEAQFMSAYGVGAALHEFSGAVYEPDKGAIILQFNTPATAGSDKILLKKNVPYMIHPAKIKFTQRKEIQLSSTGGVEFVTESGQSDYATTPVIATFDVESDLFVKWDVIMTGSDPLKPEVTLESTINKIKNNTATALTAAAVTKSLDASKAPAGQKPLPADFTFKGSYLGAKLYAPEGINIYVGESPTLPMGAYYLGYDPATMSQPKFFKAKGTATWIPYGALIEKTGASASGAGAKVFEALDLDFNDLSDYMVETGIGAPTIQIPVVNTDSKIYNLNGQVVRENSKDTNGLKGIYIVGGKKVIFN